MPSACGSSGAPKRCRASKPCDLLLALSGVRPDTTQWLPTGEGFFVDKTATGSTGGVTTPPPLAGTPVAARGALLHALRRKPPRGRYGARSRSGHRTGPGAAPHAHHQSQSADLPTAVIWRRAAARTSSGTSISTARRTGVRPGNTGRGDAIRSISTRCSSIRVRYT